VPLTVLKATDRKKCAKEKFSEYDSNNRYLKKTPFFHCMDIALSPKRICNSNSFYERREASYDGYLFGSVTLEMVVILPLFISFMVFFLFLFRVLLVQESMEEALVYTARTMAVGCYDETAEEQTGSGTLLAQAQVTLYQALSDSDCPVGYIRGKRAGISLLSSELTRDDVILRASYRMRLPCILLGTYEYQFQQCAQSRKWIGNQSLGDSSDTEQWVYITPSGTVYHCSRACRYLDLSIRGVRKGSVASMRNASGGIYHPCESCGGAASTVYITDYGNRYHSSLSCGGLKRTIYMVKISQVGGRRACSKCGTS
jgi:hypothetical protein